jgi:hypothetical protein
VNFIFLDQLMEKYLEIYASQPGTLDCEPALCAAQTLAHGKFSKTYNSLLFPERSLHGLIFNDRCDCNSATTDRGADRSSRSATLNIARKKLNSNSQLCTTTSAPPRTNSRGSYGASTLRADT